MLERRTRFRRPMGGVPGLLSAIAIDARSPPRYSKYGRCIAKNNVNVAMCRANFCDYSGINSVSKHFGPMFTWCCVPVV